MARVLIVEDEPDILLLLQMSVNAAGYDTSVAADGDVALHRISQTKYDVVLLDLWMPVLDGWQVLDRLNESTDSPAVIVVSAHPDAARSLKMGAVEWVMKPFAVDDVINTIRRVLNEAPTNGNAPGEQT